MATLQLICIFIKVNRSPHFMAILLAIFLTAVTAGPAFSDGGHGGNPISRSNAQLPVLCLPHDFLVSQIKGYGEEITSLGTANGKQALLFVNRETGSWSWVVRLDRQTSCIAAGGDGWRDAPKSLVGDPS